MMSSPPIKPSSTRMPKLEVAPTFTDFSLALPFTNKSTLPFFTAAAGM